MNRRMITTIISRSLFIIGAGLCLLFGYWIVQMSLAPVAVPPPPPARKNVTFDSRLDVSKNNTFSELRPIGPMDVEVPLTGRENPFARVPVLEPLIALPVIATSTTSTVSAPSRPF